MIQSNHNNKFILGFIVTAFAFIVSVNASLAKDDLGFDSIILVPKENTLKIKRMNRFAYKNHTLRFQKVNSKIYTLPLSATDNKEEINKKIAELKKSGLFEIVEPDYKLGLDKVSERQYVKIIKHSEEDTLNVADTNTEEITPNDRDFISQYYLREINATKAWSVSKGKDSIIVGVLDTGTDANHPDLAGKIIGEPGINTTDDIGHGTEVSGMIAANTNNSEGIAGIGWNTKILPIKITDEFGQAKVSTVVQALDEASSRGVKIVQISLSTNQFSQTLQDAIKEAQSRGILVVSTGGNTGIEELRYPASFDGVIGVGAVNQDKQKESYSTTGEHISLVAPGASIFTTTTGSSYSAVTGTSFSAPQVAGAAALVWSIAPGLSSDDVGTILFQSAEDLGSPGKDHYFGYGLLNIQRAVEMAKEKTNQTIIPEVTPEKNWIRM